MKKLVKKFWKENVVVFLLIVGAGVSTTLASFVNASILNSLIKFNLELFLMSVFKLILVFLFFLTFTYFQIIQVRKTTQKMSKYLRFKIIEKVTTLSSTEFKKNSEGDYISWLSNDINQIEEQGITVFYELLTNVINLSLAIIALLYIHWSLLILTVIEIFIIIQLPKLFGDKMKKSTLKITETNQAAVSKTTNLLAGFSTFFHFNNLGYLASELKKEFSNIEEAKNKQTTFMAKVTIIGGLGNVIGQISSYALTGYLVLLGRLSVGMLTTTSSLSSHVFNTVGNLSQYIATINGVEPLIEKINTFSLPSEIQKNVKTVSSLKSGIELKKLTFGYEEKEPILKNINYKFDLNKKYAISGNSGTGKSTILNLIIKNLEPTDGKIMLSNSDIKDISVESLLSNITYIEQNPYVFNGTIRENLSLGDVIEDKDIKNVLEYVDLKEFSNQLDILITENGSNFSGGQKQRLALARGLVRNSSIILLDESTSSLDEKTALSIENFILDIPDKTVIMVSHHLSSNIKNRLDGILNL